MSCKGLVTQPIDAVYLYDGSLPGFLCCVHRSVYQRELPGDIQNRQNAQPTLFEQIWVDTEPDKAKRVADSVPKKISPRAWELVEQSFLSHREHKEMELLRFLLLGYKEGSKTPWMFGHPDVVPVLQAEKHIMGESHLLKGFIRFSEYDGVLAAAITPKNFILPFLVEHFVMRYPEEDFMIYDKTHKAALVYQNRKHSIIPLEDMQFPEASEEERAYRELWKRFYKTIAIEARTNHKCRRTHMPKRYWENMTEMQEYL